MKYLLLLSSKYLLAKELAEYCEGGEAVEADIKFSNDLLSEVLICCSARNSSKRGRLGKVES